MNFSTIVRLFRWSKLHSLLSLVVILPTLLLINVKPATAHHAIEGRIPANLFEGFLSGLAHPIIGLDHLAFVIAIGILSTGLVRGFLLPGAFLSAAMAGTGIHLLGVDLPLTEVAIAFSIIIVGIILACKPNLNINIIATLGGLAGLFHGYAYGESIIGAKMTALVSYLAGFTLIQFLIALVAMALTNWASHKWQNLSKLQLWFGIAISTIGLIFFTQAIV